MEKAILHVGSRLRLNQDSHWKKRRMIKNANCREFCDYFGLAFAMKGEDFRLCVRSGYGFYNRQ